MLKPGKIYDEGQFIFVALQETRRYTLCKVLVRTSKYKSQYSPGFEFKCDKTSPRQLKSEIVESFVLRGTENHKLGRFYT